MKYTILGFNQQRAVELGLSLTELALLRWFVDFSGSEKMQKFQTHDGMYAWVYYQKVLDDMPIVDCNRRNLAAKMKKLVDAGVLKNHTVKVGGSFSTYALGPEYDSLIGHGGAEGVCPKSDRGYVRNQTEGMSEIRQTKIPPLDYPSIKNNTPQPPKGKEDEPKENPLMLRFDRFWSAYPKRQAKGTARKAWERLKPDDALLDRMLAAIAWQQRSEQWRKDGGQFIPLPATWLNAQRWEDDKSKYTMPESQYNFLN